MPVIIKANFYKTSYFNST